MIYRFLRVLVSITLHAYFRRIIVNDVQKLPLDKPVLIASNHPNAFLEAVLLACFLPRPLHFLVRADVFKNPRFRWFLKATNQVPIYRFRDGFANLRNNAKTFEFCYETLKEGKAILIFAEGSTEMVRRLRPLQKGTARIAMGALDYSPDLDLEIVPVGVNFSDPTLFRSDVMIRVGDPLSAREYLEAYSQDQPGTMQVITDNVRERLQPCVVHIPEHIHEQQVVPLFTILRSTDRGFRGPFFVKDSTRFYSEWALAKRLGEMSPKFYEYLIEKLETLERLMPTLDFKRPVTFLHRAGWGMSLLGLIMLPLHWLAYLFFLIPWGIAQFISERKVKAIEFYAPVRIGAGLLLTGIWAMLLWILAGLLLPWGWYWAWILTWIFLPIRIYLRDFYLMRAPGIRMQFMNSNRRKKIRNQFDQLLLDVKKLAETRSETDEKDRK